MALTALGTAGIDLGSKLLASLFGGGGGKDPTAILGNKVLREFLNRILQDDSGKRIDAANVAARGIFEKFGGNAIENALGRLGAGGSRIDLPDTQRGAIVSSALNRVGDTLALKVFDEKANAFERDLQNAGFILSQVRGGKGQPIQLTGGSRPSAGSITQSFSNVLQEAFRQ